MKILGTDGYLDPRIQVVLGSALAIVFLINAITGLMGSTSSSDTAMAIIYFVGSFSFGYAALLGLRKLRSRPKTQD